jgi:hypothetical protein
MFSKINEQLKFYIWVLVIIWLFILDFYLVLFLIDLLIW